MGVVGVPMGIKAGSIGYCTICYGIGTGTGAHGLSTKNVVQTLVVGISSRRGRMKVVAFARVCVSAMWLV